MRKVWQYVIGTIVGGIIGVVSYSLILYFVQSYPYHCGPEFAGEGTQYLPGICNHWVLVLGSVLVCIPISLVVSLIGCRLVDTRYKGYPKYEIIVGGILGGLVIPFIYIFLVLVAFLVAFLT